MNNDAFWTFPQALKWVMSRDQSALDDIGVEQADPQASAGLFAYIMLSELADPDPTETQPIMSADDAFAEIRSRLSAGAMTANAIDLTTSERREVQVMEWIDLQWHGGDRFFLDTKHGMAKLAGPVIADVRLAARDVVALWPPQDRNRDDWVAAQELARAAWERPEGLNTTSLENLGDSSRLPLMPVVRLLAFGQQSAPEGLSAMHVVASRVRAARALLAAAQTGSIELSGRLATESTPKKIDAFVFDVPHSLVSDDDTAIEPDLNAVSMERLAELRAAEERARRDNRPPPSRWLDVHVGRLGLQEFIGGKTARVSSDVGPPAAQVTQAIPDRTSEASEGRPLGSKDMRLSDDEVKTLIRAKELELKRRPPIRIWANWAEMTSGGVTKPIFESLWREVYPDPPRGRPPKAEKP